MADREKSGMFNHKLSARFVANNNIFFQRSIRDEIYETNAEVHRELNAAVVRKSRT